jgi:hypothetical protein
MQVDNKQVHNEMGSSSSNQLTDEFEIVPLQQ